MITVEKSDGVSVATRTNSADGPVSFAGVEAATIDGQAGNDSLLDPGGTNLTLRGGPGNDTIAVRDTTGPVTAEDHEGTNTFVVTMGHLAGPVTIANTGGTSRLTIQAPPGSYTLTLSATQLTGAGETINLNLGPTATGLTLDGNPAPQVVLDGAPPAPVSAPNIDVLPGAGCRGTGRPGGRDRLGVQRQLPGHHRRPTPGHRRLELGRRHHVRRTVSQVQRYVGHGERAPTPIPPPGVYTVTLTVTDNRRRGGSRSVSPYVVGYDPSAGFVTGGGWIDSPAGAYAANPALTGKANFGFVSKYQNGNNVPTGNTEFQFKVGRTSTSRARATSGWWSPGPRPGTGARARSTGPPATGSS